MSRNGYEVSLHDVSYKYSELSDEKILDGISIKIKSGQFVGVIGSNAAGKSSFLKAIAGELKNIKGEVEIGGRIIDRPVNQLIDGVGIVHQFEACDLIENLSVAQNVAIRQILGGGHRSKVFSTNPEWTRKVSARLGRLGGFGIKPPDIEKIVKNLSGGQKQILNVIIAIHFEHEVNPCGLLLLDEHTSRLDHKNAERVMSFTAKEVQKYKITTIMVTHKYIDALNYADRILAIRDGKILRDIKEVKRLSLEDITTIVEGEC